MTAVHSHDFANQLSKAVGITEAQAHKVLELFHIDKPFAKLGEVTTQATPELVSFDHMRIAFKPSGSEVLIVV